jgi:putative ABC transport system permease protein
MMLFYRALLHLYPSAFRAQYGEEMCGIFARRLRQTSSIPQSVALWMETLFDVFLNSARVHWDILLQDFRYTARTLSRAPGFALLLSFAVSHRTQEIGVRLALGAQARDIIAMVLREGVLLAAAGVILGLALAYWAGRAMEALLAGVSPWDAPTFSTAVGLALAMTIVGSLLPVLRALRVDPTTAIRAE